MKWILFFGLAAAAFGQTPGPSAGALLGAVLESQYYQIDGSTNPSPYKSEAKIAMSYLTMGGFVDFTYVEASLTLLVQVGPQSSKVSPPNQPPDDRDIDSRFVDLAGRLLAKYPLALGKTVTFFPLAGLEYSRNLSYQNKEPFLSDAELNDVFLDFGAGLDFPLGTQTYLRAEGIYGLNLTPSSQDIKDKAAFGGGSYADFGSRLNFSLGIGSRF